MSERFVLSAADMRSCRARRELEPNQVHHRVGSGCRLRANCRMMRPRAVHRPGGHLVILLFI